MKMLLLAFVVIVLLGLKSRHTNMAGPGSGLPQWLDGWTKDSRVLIYPVVAVVALAGIYVLGVLAVVVFGVFAAFWG